MERPAGERAPGTQLAAGAGRALCMCRLTESRESPARQASFPSPRATGPGLHNQCVTGRDPAQVRGTPKAVVPPLPSVLPREETHGLPVDAGPLDVKFLP